jgi:hypothetical protein
MAGQTWSVPSEGGYLYSDELSDVLRMTAQPLTKFRQFCDAKDGSSKGLHRGNLYNWNTFTNVGTQGRRLEERQPIPETGFTIVPHQLTIFEAGNSIPYTGRLSDWSKQDLIGMIDVNLKEDARKYFDAETFTQFNRTVARFSPVSGTSTTAIVVTTNSATAQTNNVALGTGHIKAISDYMKEANVPAFMDDNYMCISHVSTLRGFKNQLEAIKQYTELGLRHIFAGEIGIYENVRFVEQNFIPKGGANDSTTYDPFNNVSDPWNNAASSWAFFFGADTVTEALVVPEEIRAKIPGDFGRSKGIAWYYEGGFGLVHDDTADPRVFKWDSAA